MHQVSEPALDERLGQMLQREPVAAYVGFDPTADSLHVGHFLGIMGLIYAQRAGVRPIAVVGGATGMIGDPSGKSVERQLLTKEVVARNVDGIRRVLERFLDFNHPTAPATIVNNLDWFGAMSAIDFLREVGRHFRIGPMLAKDSVRSRMETSDQGMSYTEFSYQLLQGYDFYRLFKEHRCVLQLGGSDQWGNITAGIDLIRKLEGEGGHAFGATWPLMTTASGQKFGKSEGNAVWLTADRTSPFDFYQFWLRTEDADVARYLRFFTFLPLEQVEQIVAEHEKDPSQRVGQKRLAEEVTTLVQGADATATARTASETMYGGQVEQFTDATIEALAAQGVPTTRIERGRIEDGWPLIDALVETGLAKTKSDARRLIAQGGIYLNNHAINDVKTSLTTQHLATQHALVLRSGKKNYRLVKVG